MTNEPAQTKSRPDIAAWRGIVAKYQKPDNRLVGFRKLRQPSLTQAQFSGRKTVLTHQE